MFPNSRHINISGGVFKSTVEQNGLTGLQILHQRVSHSAAHDSVEHAPKCHPETRKVIVGDIMSWIEDTSRTSSVLWFNGPAGAGKTAIAQTLCKLCADKQWLGGSFFFSRLAFGRNDPIFLISTIAYQLSLAIPQVGNIINGVIADDPSLATKDLEIQLRKLIVEPLQQVVDLPRKPIVIIIDGMDECEGEAVQSNVLRLLGSIFQHRPFDGLARVCFIVTSRPEPWIRDEFDMEPLSRITRQLFLGQTAEANDDIRTFLRMSFTEIHESPKHRHTMSNVAKPWPSYQVIDDLVDRASGQFIYPATILKFVDDPHYRPTDRLDIVTSIPSTVSSPSTQKPLAALDQLYSQILSTSSDKKCTLDILAALVAMLRAKQSACIIWAFQMETLRIAERLLGLRPQDGALALRGLHSLVHITGRVLISDIADDDLSVPGCLKCYQHPEEDMIRFHHKSFIDYLIDPSRSLGYCVNMLKMESQLVLACLHMMQTFSLQPASRITCFTWGYAILFWSSHLTSSEPASVFRALKNFDIFNCYVSTLGPQKMGQECWNTIQRVVFSNRPIRRDSWILKTHKEIINKKCPNQADVEAVQESLILFGDKGIPLFYYITGLNSVVTWMKKYLVLPELIRQYETLARILQYYSAFTPGMPIPPKPDKYFTQKVHM